MLIIPRALFVSSTFSFTGVLDFQDSGRGEGGVCGSKEQLGEHPAVVTHALRWLVFASSWRWFPPQMLEGPYRLSLGFCLPCLCDRPLGRCYYEGSSVGSCSARC